jgi:hypothetical protein
MVEAVGRLVDAFDRRAVRYALIGGLAFGFRARFRTTKDADFIVQVPALTLPALFEDLVAVGFEIDVAEAIRKWSADRFLVFYQGDARIDWMQPIIPLYSHVLDMAEPRPWHGHTVRIATAEGLIVTKMAAFRLQDQADIEILLSANGPTLDTDWVRKEWSSVTSPDDPRTIWLESAFDRLLPRRA